MRTYFITYFAVTYTELKSTSVKEGYTKSKMTPKFGAGTICKIELLAQSKYAVN